LQTFIVIASIASILGFIVGAAASQSGRQIITDIKHAICVPLLGVRLVRLGIYEFFDSRDARNKGKNAANTLNYIADAKKEIGIISLSLNYSILHLGLQNQLRTMIKSNPLLNIYLFLLDPESPIVESAARVTNRNGDELRELINQSLIRVTALHDMLDPMERQRFHLHLYSAYIANTILVVDPYEKTGHILVENYLYKRNIEERYSFECKRPGSKMFDKVRQAYEEFKEDFTKR
jgi:hypothetical protein